jgi:hypothetical protein
MLLLVRCLPIVDSTRSCIQSHSHFAPLPSPLSSSHDALISFSPPFVRDIFDARGLTLIIATDHDNIPTFFVDVIVGGVAADVSFARARIMILTTIALVGTRSFPPSIIIIFNFHFKLCHTNLADDDE